MLTLNTTAETAPGYDPHEMETVVSILHRVRPGTAAKLEATLAAIEVQGLMQEPEVDYTDETAAARPQFYALLEAPAMVVTRFA